MDEITILIGIGLILVGFLIGYPFGHIFGQRTTARAGNGWRRRTSRRDILNAEVIE